LQDLFPKAQGEIRVGCCGFPEARSLYYRHYPVVEIQQTFYQLPRVETVLKWRREAPPDFIFSMKVWQAITHEATSPTYRRMRMPIDVYRKKDYGAFKPTRVVMQAWENTRKIAQALRAQVLVFQCPGSFQPTDTNLANMRRFFTSVNRGNFYFVWEPRGRWEPETVRQLCEELHLIHGVDPFRNAPVAGEIFYFRLHGKSSYRYAYTDEELAELKDVVLSLSKPGFVMFNNSNMKADASRFIQLLNQEADVAKNV
jgi:uncharacterized protein YecE (DUF72 family)